MAVQSKNWTQSAGGGDGTYPVRCCARLELVERQPKLLRREARNAADLPRKLRRGRVASLR